MHLGMIPDSKILKKGVQIGPKLKHRPSTSQLPIGPNFWPSPVTS